MKSYYIKGHDINIFFKTVIESRQLIAPVKEDDVILFRKINKIEDIVLNYENTIVPPKNLFFPQSEKLFEYKNEDNKVFIKNNQSYKERVIFGIRMCDIESLNLLDNIFDKGFNDSYYKEKRENTILIELGCTNLCKKGFCSSLELVQNSTSADIVFYPVREDFFVTINTIKGENLIDLIHFKESKEDMASLIREATLGDKTIISSIPQELDEIFENKIWEEISQKCIGCNVCTYVCPTCHCFDMCDIGNRKQGERIRCWDSCMNSRFTQMAGNHNPRDEKQQRVRQRILHKFKYYPEEHGKVACVGCGRCLQKCPVGMDILENLRKVKEAGCNV